MRAYTRRWRVAATRRGRASGTGSGAGNGGGAPTRSSDDRYDAVDGKNERPGEKIREPRSERLPPFLVATVNGNNGVNS